MIVPYGKLTFFVLPHVDPYLLPSWKWPCLMHLLPALPQITALSLALTLSDDIPRMWVYLLWTYVRTCSNFLVKKRTSLHKTAFLTGHENTKMTWVKIVYASKSDWHMFNWFKHFGKISICVYFLPGLDGQFVVFLLWALYPKRW